MAGWPVSSPYLVKSHQKVKLSHFPTADTGRYQNKEEAAVDLERHRQKLDELQELLTADCRHAVLIVLQGMDTSGKDGTIRHIFTGVNPQACNVTSFKVPTPLELRHDFLWRAHRNVPQYGTIGIFNRSHYEDVLVTRVHKQVSDKLAKERFKQIVDFEMTLAENNITILKFFLHISRAEQTRRLAERLKDKNKHWKLNKEDFAERGYWPQYMKAYEDAIEHTSRKHAPWFIIPADHKWYRNVAISEILVNAISKLKMNYPKPDFDPGKIKL
ncbi:polyphosphate kinase 2 family protein [Alloacidobacterium sp.]|uniref:polyphosphate kinase 2 family protein n=1 Tax=Alloacidobacterium sp. TaxID=2951999 RepID=UPI002D47404D|nr:polyphosphate kinase 2 family protein [Alloacidobacterium sp.]HYK35182.1 polyphosphate kinase 2 family protein [Alloacidobacterium sp.]